VHFPHFIACRLYIHHWNLHTDLFHFFLFTYVSGSIALLDPAIFLFSLCVCVWEREWVREREIGTWCSRGKMLPFCAECLMIKISQIQCGYFFVLSLTFYEIKTSCMWRILGPHHGLDPLLSCRPLCQQSLLSTCHQHLLYLNNTAIPAQSSSISLCYNFTKEGDYQFNLVLKTLLQVLKQKREHCRKF
jgi:hypothetical protein